MTNPNNPNPRDFAEQEPPYDPEIDGPVEGQPAVDGQQAAAGQPATEQGQRHAEAANAPQSAPQNAPQNASADQEMLGATGDAQDGNLEKDPSDWVSGDDPATESQKSYIDAMSKQAGEQIPANLTKAQASEQIDRLKKITGM